MRTLCIIATLMAASLPLDAWSRICPKNRNFPMVDKGMSFVDVTGLIGKPVSAESGPDDTKIYYYCLSSSFLDSDGSDTREYWVQLKEGKVIAYGERNDLAAAMRAQRQHASAWAGANMIVNSANQAADRLTNNGHVSVRTLVNVQQNSFIESNPNTSIPEHAPVQQRSDWRKWNGIKP